MSLNNPPERTEVGDRRRGRVAAGDLHEVQLAELAARRRRLHGAVRRVEAPVEADVQQGAGRLDRGERGVDLGEVERHRLLAERRQPGRGDAGDQLGVGVGAGADRHRVDVAGECLVDRRCRRDAERDTERRGRARGRRRTRWPATHRGCGGRAARRATARSARSREPPPAPPFTPLALVGLGLVEGGPRRPDRRPIGHLGHADLPPRAALGPRVRVDVDDDDRGAVRRPRPLDRVGELGDVGDAASGAAHRRGVGGEVDRRPLPCDPHVGEQVVERRPALVDLQPVDDGEAAVVAQDHDHLVPGQHRRVQVAVHHQVRAVADEHERLTVRRERERAIAAPHPPEIS